MKNINIDDGREAISINGDPERVIYIQASDFNIQLRARQAREKISGLLEEIDKKKPGNEAEFADFLEEIDKKKPGNEAEFADFLEEIDKKVREQINHIFNYDVSQPVFGLCSPLMSLKNGKCYVEEFLEAITPVIEDIAKKAAKASEKRIAKHTKRYG